MRGQKSDNLFSNDSSSTYTTLNFIDFILSRKYNNIYLLDLLSRSTDNKRSYSVQLIIYVQYIFFAKLSIIAVYSNGNSEQMTMGIEGCEKLVLLTR